MLVLDTNLLSDYLVGEDAARSFLTAYEDEEWAISTVALYEVMMGAVYENLPFSPEEVMTAVSSAMGRLPVTSEIVVAAVSFQRELLTRGVPCGAADALVAAPASHYEGRFATADRHFWKDEVQSVLDVVEYDPEH